jgi:hypothetical protein
MATLRLRLRQCSNRFPAIFVAAIQERSMAAREDLRVILSELEGEAVRVSFLDGEMYDLEIKSTVRAHDEGTFDTTVIWAINCIKPTNIETGNKMKFRVEDVARIQVLKNARCVFERGEE